MFIFNTSLRLRSGYSTQTDELRRQIDIEAKNGRDTVRMKENLCNAYIAAKNVEKIEELTKNYTFGDFIHHKIINMHIEMGSTEHALDHFNEIRKSRPNFKLNRNDTVRLAHAMFKEKREWSELIRVFTENKQIRLKGQNGNEIRLFLQTVAETGKPAEMDELFDVLVENNFAVKDGLTAGYLVKVHLVNNDLAAAVHTFEKQFEESKLISYLVPLMKALIVTDDLEKLQKVCKLVHSKRSKADTVLSLVTSFIQLGNIDLARVLLDHNMPHISDHSFRTFWERYNEYGYFSLLEGLLEATAGLDYDCRIIYSHLLGHLIDQNKTDAALDLWRQQLDRNEEPSKEFLQVLASHLNENGLRVPFHEPFAIAPMLPSHLSPEGIQEMKTALRNADVDAALEFRTKIKPNSTQYVYLTSELLRLLCKSKIDRSTDAVDIAIESFELNRRVNDESLCDLIQRIADDGHTQLLERFGDYLPRPTKRSIRFVSELLKAYERAGKWNEFFSTTLRKLHRNAYVNDRFPMMNLLAHLQKQNIPLSECKRSLHISFLILNANDIY